MTKVPLRSVKLDEHAYRDADTQFKLVSSVLSEHHLETLAREVVRRLAFRLPRSLHPDHVPGDDNIAALCDALLSDEDAAGDQIILTARADGVSAESIYLYYVAGAARRLGKLWDADEISFVEVTLASGRLYRIIRGLRHVIDPAASLPQDRRHVLLALVPGETHTLGGEIAADIFRRRGWDVELSVGNTHDEVLERIENNGFAAVVLVANHERVLGNLIALVLSLRITRPMIRIAVAGNIVQQVENVDQLVGADAVLTEIRTATADLEALIEAP